MINLYLKTYHTPFGLYLHQGDIYVMDDFGNLVEHSDAAYEQLVCFRHDNYYR